MPYARHGDVELFYETFGAESDPVLLLVNGLGSQCINYHEDWCRLFAERGHRVVRFDNRDVGLSSKLDGVLYSLADMAGDAAAVLDAVGAERAHVMGLSMGGMIAQQLAIDHPDRVLTLTSVMSRTGEPGFGEATQEALASLMKPPAQDRDEYVEGHLAALDVYGSEPEWRDLDEDRARAEAAYDRCFHPEGVARQIAAIMAAESRDDALRRLAVPTLVLHGSRDTLIQPDGGRHTAEVIPGARFVEIEGMGHDYPRTVWDLWVSTWADFVAEVAAPA